MYELSIDVSLYRELFAPAPSLHDRILAELRLIKFSPRLSPAVLADLATETTRLYPTWSGFGHRLTALFFKHPVEYSPENFRVYSRIVCELTR